MSWMLLIVSTTTLVITDSHNIAKRHFPVPQQGNDYLSPFLALLMHKKQFFAGIFAGNQPTISTFPPTTSTTMSGMKLLDEKMK